MELTSLKPFFTNLLLPSSSALLLIFIGILSLRIKNKRYSRICLYGGLAAAWILSCNLSAQWLNTNLLKHYAFTTPKQIKKNKVQAIVVLGSGIQSYAPEYLNASQPSSTSAARLRYGAWLYIQTRIPIAFSGGHGWATRGGDMDSEAKTARFYLKSFKLPPPKWLDDRSADTAENAQEMARILLPLGITRIALVTHAWHMERSVRLFGQQGFVITPAPIQTITPEAYGLLNIIPSAEGVTNVAYVLKEVLALTVMNIKEMTIF